MSFAEGGDFDAGKRVGDQVRGTKDEERSEGVRRNGVVQVETMNAKPERCVGTKSMHRGGECPTRIRTGIAAIFENFIGTGVTKNDWQLVIRDFSAIMQT